MIQFIKSTLNSFVKYTYFFIESVEFLTWLFFFSKIEFIKITNDSIWFRNSRNFFRYIRLNRNVRFIFFLIFIFSRFFFRSIISICLIIFIFSLKRFFSVRAIRLWSRIVFASDFLTTTTNFLISENFFFCLIKSVFLISFFRWRFVSADVKIWSNVEI